MKALITGATGFIGQHLVRHLLDENWQVRALSRSTSNKPAEFAGKIEWVTGDLAKPASLAEAVKDVDVIFHLAGAIKAPDAATFSQINVHGTRNLLEAISTYAKKETRLVYVSSLSAGGPSAHGSPKSEDEPCYPVSAYGQSKLEGEIEVLKRKHKIWCVVIRPAVVYGPGDKETFVFFKIAKSHLNPHLGFEKRFVSLIYVADLVNLLRLAATGDRPSGEIYFACDERSNGYDWNEIIATAAKILKYRVFNIYIPNLFLTAMLLPSIIKPRTGGRQRSFNRDKYRELIQTYWTCSSAKAQGQLGFKPETNLPEGLTRAADWYRTQKWIK